MNVKGWCSFVSNILWIIGRGQLTLSVRFMKLWAKFHQDWASKSEIKITKFARRCYNNALCLEMPRGVLSERCRKLSAWACREKRSIHFQKKYFISIYFFFPFASDVGHFDVRSNLNAIDCKILIFYSFSAFQCYKIS